MSQPGETAVVMEGPSGERDVLASDADRDTVAGLLSSAFAEGRLTSGEHAERVRAVYGVRTLGELARLTADLPGPAGEAGGLKAVLVRDDGIDRCLLCAARSPQPARASVAEGYRRAAEPWVRGLRCVAVTVVLFAVAGAADGRGGAAIAGAWTLAAGLYCLANFLHCRETHCGVTGPGWIMAGVLGLAAALTPGGSLAWYRVSVQAAVFLAVLAAGYGIEYVVAARTGRRSLGGGSGGHAEDR